MHPTDEPFALPELWPPGTQVKGDYIIEKRLGAGGFGTVYLARHRFLGTCVIKRLHDQFAADREYVRKFVQEGATIRRLQECPHIVKVHDVTQTEDWHLIIVLEFVPGGDLASLMDKRTLQPEEVVEYARQIAVGLEAAHQAGLVHRDIKPQNVLVGKTASGGPLLKLIDFGIAADRLSQHQTSVFHSGSVGYAAPEQWMKSGKELDGRTDLYALGATMFRMLTGQMPYPDAADIGTWIDRARTSPPRPVHEIRPEINRELSLLVQQLLAVRPEDRPPTAAAVISRLDALRNLVAPPYQEAFTMPPAMPPERGEAGRRPEPTRIEEAAEPPRTAKRYEPEAPPAANRPFVILATGVAVLVMMIGGWKFLTPAAEPPAGVASKPQDVPIEQHPASPAAAKPPRAAATHSSSEEHKPVPEPSSSRSEPPSGAASKPEDVPVEQHPPNPVAAKPPLAPAPGSSAEGREPASEESPSHDQTSKSPLPPAEVKASPPLPDPSTRRGAMGTRPGGGVVTPGELNEGPYKVGGDVTAPTATFQVEPEYAEPARKARIEGVVVIGFVVDANGVPRSPRIVQSLDPGLDQKAIEALQKWRFHAGEKAGRPVSTYCTIEVRFRLLKQERRK